MVGILRGGQCWVMVLQSVTPLSKENAATCQISLEVVTVGI